MQCERKANRKAPIDGVHRFGSSPGLSQVRLCLHVAEFIR